MKKMAKAVSVAALRSPNLGWWLFDLPLQIAKTTPVKLLHVSENGVILFNEEAVGLIPEEDLAHVIVHEALHWAHNRTNKTK
jgi:hypothetical protein